MDKIKATKKMRGFVCHSPAATAVCMTIGDRRSVTVPRRPDRTLHHDHQLHHSKLISNNVANYSRLQLVDQFPKHLPVSNRRAAPTPHHKPSSLTPSTVDHVFQVVVMRVSIHCQGCAGKVKKHLSKMEGVTSFSIDLETKRVTVMGHVSPVGVLESISKVKRAELWTC